MGMSEVGFIMEVSFAQWQYHSQWGLSEAWLLLVENYTQYPAPSPWKMGGCAIFVRLYGGIFFEEKIKALSSSGDGPPFGRNRRTARLMCPFVEDLGPHPHLTQSRLGRGLPVPPSNRLPPLGRGSWVPQCGLDGGLPPCQVSSWSI